MKSVFRIIIVSAVFFSTGLKAQNLQVSQAGEIQSIRQAVELAEPHQTIEIQAGVYSEHSVIIDKPLKIKARSGAIIDGEGQGFVLIVRSDSVSIEGIEVRNTGISFMEDVAGILIEKSAHVLIEGVTLTDTFFGIYLSETSNSVLRNNTLTASGERETQSGNGIHLWYSRDITIENNEIRGHRDGIYFEFVKNITITGNVSENNLRYGQHFMFSDECVFTENIFRDNGAGVAVMYTSKVTMRNNHFSDNWGSAAYGLLMKEIRQSEVTDNTFSGNSIGMYLEASSRNRIKRNTFQSNGWAIKVMANSMDNLFEQNNFVDNTFEVATNSRQNFNIFNNNYWSHYDGYDLDRDGIGDVPHQPVRLFSIMIEKQPEVLVLSRSMLIGILDTAERILPVLTPDNLVDKKPQMARIQ